MCLLLLVATQLEVLATLQHSLVRASADRALELQHNLLGRLHLLVEDGLARCCVVAGAVEFPAHVVGCCVRAGGV